ncbi:COG1943 Transposase and inactivated derivatives [uncultured Caudovirales phage]|uniref:COG1943 Transposase and inactivated derivatives n=1 Tax=uncultured Caudovirales phage TaxID=2100421 RepID=A0A6J5L6E8_9CAUD|nr:COG1943 Transposase and inactivated derivatives [uncultured Caudovirales phage]
MSLHKKPANKGKFCLKMHLIFVVKYRKKLLDNFQICAIIKGKLLALQTSDFTIEVMETDKDHIHMLVSYSPNVTVSQVVRKLKQETTYDVWQKIDLSKYFWKERTFWSDGYFVCSIGNASEQTIKNYIENKG